MHTMFIDGQKIKKDILDSLKVQVEQMETKPKLSIFTIGDDFAMKSFVGIKKKAAEYIGVSFEEINLREDISENDLLDLMEKESEGTNGIVVQLPLPDHTNKDKVIDSIDSNLDIDVLSKKTYENFLESDRSVSVPPVAGSVWNILEYVKDQEGEELKNKKVVIVGNGFLTGKPVYDLLSKNNFSNVTVIDEDTDADLFNKHLLEAEILISGTGVPNLIKKEMIGDGVILIDMGSSSDKGVLTGDISLYCSEKASFFSKTPGGVGPGTVAVLFENLIKSFKINNNHG